MMIRWVRRRDLPFVVAMYSQDTVEQQEVERQLAERLRQRNQIGLVRTDQYDRILAFCVYELQMWSLDVKELMVHPGQRRRGYGTELIEHLKAKIKGSRRSKLNFWVPEEALDVQLFLRAQGIICTGIEGDMYRFALSQHEMEQVA